jgi:mercuric ion transport protein
MDERKEQRLARAGMAASLTAAVGASVCCIGPVTAAMFGVTSLAALVKYEPLRPFFAIVTLATLSVAFFMTYRKRPAGACEPGSVCATQGVDRVQRFNRVMLWTATAVALVVLTFPTWSGWMLG